MKWLKRVKKISEMKTEETILIALNKTVIC